MKKYICDGLDIYDGLEECSFLEPDVDCRNNGCEHMSEHDELDLGICDKVFCIISQCDVKCLDIRVIRKKKLERLEHVVFKQKV